MTTSCFTRLSLAICLAATLTVSTSQCPAADKPFTHPGILHTRAELDLVKAKIAEGAEPWKSAWKELRSHSISSLDWKPNPVANVVRGVRNKPDIGGTNLLEDGAAAYAHAIQWVVNGRNAHAKKAIEILNAYASSLKSVGGHDARLLIGMAGISFVNAAEIIRHTEAGWSDGDQKQFARMLREVFYAGIKDFYPTANGNWDASMIQTMIAMGVFLDDREMFQRAVDYYMKGQGNGAIGKYFNDFGECQESGRDQSHVQMGLGYLGCAAEIGWKQGVDMYGACDNRLALGFEYTAKYNLGRDVPYKPYRSHKGRYTYRTISRRGRGRFRAIYERVYNHYHNRLGLKMPFVAQVVKKMRPERWRSSQHAGWGTLMHAEQPAAKETAKAADVSSSGPLTLWYSKPAEKWVDALPIGNGRLGAMVFGGVDQERIQLNEDTLWSGGPHCYDNPDAHQRLAAVRGAIKQGKFVDAEAMAQKMLGRPKYQQAYLPLGELLIDLPKGEKTSEYRRGLNLQNAVSQVTYRIGEARFTRKVFASHPDQAIVVHLACDKPGRITFDLSMKSEHPSKSQTISDDTLSMTGHVGPREESRLIGPWKGDGLKFAARVRVAAEGGKVVSRGDKISVNNADSVTLVYAAATSYVNYQDISGDPLAKVKKDLAGIKGKSFAQLIKKHIDDYWGLFGRVSIDLGGKDPASLPTDERIRKVAAGAVDPLLSEQLFQYGRYLMIAGSRPGTQPLNLQGIWNDKLRPKWGSKYTININIQMNYWVAEVCNLSECHEPLLRMVGELQKPGSSTAKTHYKAAGWVAHHNTDLWRGTAPVDGAQWGMWQTGGAWLCQHLWEHYLYTGDAEHLKKSYPILKGAATFFLDFLVENRDGRLMTSPSLSPEHSHGGGAKGNLSSGRKGPTVCSGPTIDMQILRDLFGNCIEASKLLDIDEEFRARLTKTRARLAPMKIGRHGQLQEWLVDWDNPEDKHSHVSHLYGLYPSSQINHRDTPKLLAAARTSLIQRGHAGGWPGAWRISLWARLRDGDRAHEVLVKHVMPRLTKNLFNKGSIFQIDANFGATAGIAEMLLQSHRGEIRLLPALPKAWPAGRVTGLRARGGFEVNLQWKDGALTQAEIKSVLGKRCRVTSGVSLVVTSGGRQVTTRSPGPSIIEFDTNAGKTYRLSAGALPCIVPRAMLGPLPDRLLFRLSLQYYLDSNVQFQNQRKCEWASK